MADRKRSLRSKKLTNIGKSVLEKFLKEKRHFTLRLVAGLNMGEVRLMCGDI